MLGRTTPLPTATPKKRAKPSVKPALRWATRSAKAALRWVDRLVIAAIAAGAVLGGVAGALALLDRFADHDPATPTLAQAEIETAPEAAPNAPESPPATPSPGDPGVYLRDPSAAPPLPDPPLQAHPLLADLNTQDTFGLRLEVMRDPPGVRPQNVRPSQLTQAPRLWSHEDDPNVADAVRIRINLDRPAYVWLLMVDPRGDVRTILPATTADAQATGGALHLPAQPTYLPAIGSPVEFTVCPPAGRVRIIALAAEKPWGLTGVPLLDPASLATGSEPAVRLPLIPYDTRIRVLDPDGQTQTHPSMRHAFGGHWQAAQASFEILSPRQPFPVGHLALAGYRG